jgi:F0F1-type ATP synthase assembly protein I
MRNDSPSRNVPPGAANKLVRLSAIITILPAGMAAGWILGYFLCDRLLHSFPWGSIVGTFLGAGAGFYEIATILFRDRDSDRGG